MSQSGPPHGDQTDPTVSIIPPGESATGPATHPTNASLLFRTSGASDVHSAVTAAMPTGEAQARLEEGFTAFRLHKIVGRGGMGEVWAAEQVSLGRRVAVKRLIRRHDNETRERGRLAEFRHEAHIAGMLEHPNILPVHDLGHDVSGNPLLVMKLVEGRTWSAVLDTDWKSLSADEFLSRHIPILMAMTQAVAFAHSRGIVHRDLKPAQVMVGSFGEVLLTDWGLAVRVGAPAGEGAHVEDFSTAQPWDLPGPGTASNPAGTPALMAPEQTSEDSSQIGIRTDVYLLGGTLYRLLTGEYPHSARNSREAMELAALGRIVPPSERTPGRLIPPDLEALCLHALKPRPEDRIPSAEAFWQALDDHVRGSTRRLRSREKTDEAAAALEAGPADYAAFAGVLSAIDEARRLWSDNPQCDGLKTRALAGSARQALGNGDLALANLQAGAIPDDAVAAPILAEISKAEAALRRRRTQFRFAVASAGVLLAVVAAGSLLFSRQMRLKNVELEQRTAEAVTAREQAEANLAIAKRQGDGAFDLVNFVLEDLKTAMDEELTVERGILVPVANEVSHAIAGRVAEPIVEYFESVPSGEVRAWPRELALARAEQMSATGQRFQELGRFDEAERLTSPSLELREFALGPEHSDVAGSLVELSSILWSRQELGRALPLAERAVAIREKALGPDHPDTSVALTSVSNLLDDLGEGEKAREIAERVVAIEEKAFGPGAPQTATAISNLGVMYRRAGDFDRARELLERALAIHEGNPDRDMKSLATALSALARLERESGNLERARELYERALAVREKELGPEHYETARVVQNLAGIEREQGNYDAALPKLERALAINERTLGPNHGATLAAVNSLAILHAATGEMEKALPMMERVAAGNEATHGPDHPRVADALNNVGLVRRELGDFAGARTDLERALAIREQKLGTEHPQVASTLLNLVNLYLDTGEFETALDASRRATAINEAVFGPDSPNVAPTINASASALSRLGRHEEAVRECTRAYDLAERHLGSDHPETGAIRSNKARTCLRLARVRVEEARPEEAAALAGDATTLIGPQAGRETTPGAATAIEAEALAILGRLDEARPLVEALLAAGHPVESPEISPEDREAFLRLCATLGIDPTPPEAP
jgi:serine/threonine protein kinase/Tfp pilus assembly protein PilF